MTEAPSPATSPMSSAVDSPEKTDGRRQRSVDSRARIVHALLELVGEGEVSPSAEHVASRAQVGLRSVFRHFKDMDSLYSEMSQMIEDEIVKAYLRPFSEGPLPERLNELVARRARLYERIAPFKRASLSLRHRSSYLNSQHDRMTTAMRDLLKAAMPPEVTSDAMRLETLDLLLSFDTWNRLRTDQGLEPEMAEKIIRDAVMRAVA